MKSMGKKGFELIWAIVLTAVIAISGVGYYLLQSKNKNGNNNNAVVKQENNATQPQQSAETKNEETDTGTTIKTGDSQFGSILFDGKGQAIYIWELEKSEKAECYGSCATAWPPVLTSGTPIASGGVKSELLGTTKRTDGTTQVTYNGHPLYYYAHEKAGEVKCHNVSTHGGLWWVIQPSGTRAE